MRQIAKYYVLSPKTQPFSPLDLSPALWLDASDTATITASSGSVSQWDDKSGNGRNVTQGTAAAQPTTGTRTLNGLNVVDFDGNDFLSRATFVTTSTFFIFLVVDLDVTTGDRWIIATSAENVIFGIGANQYRLIQGSNLYGGSPDTNPHVLRATFAATDTVRVDGVQVASGNAGTATMGSFLLGGKSAVTAPINGAIAEVIIVDGTLTAQQITDTETYLATKWGL